MTGYQSKRAAAQDKLAQPEQEPVAWYHNDFGVVELSRIPRAGWKPLTTPLQRPWVGLTDEDIHNTVGYNETREMYQFALALIAKLKDKNGA